MLPIDLEHYCLWPPKAETVSQLYTIFICVSQTDYFPLLLWAFLVASYLPSGVPVTEGAREEGTWLVGGSSFPLQTDGSGSLERWESSIIWNPATFLRGQKKSLWGKPCILSWGKKVHAQTLLYEFGGCINPPNPMVRTSALGADGSLVIWKP